MTTSVGSVQGLSSGIQWQDMVDQLSAIDKARELNPITASITKSQAQSDAWTSYQDVAAKLSSALSTLREGSAFDAFQVSVGTSATTGRSLLSATAQAGAAPGSYEVEVLDIARAEKLSGASFASATAALGLTSGDVSINGAKVSITAADSLNGIRDKINALNTGLSPSGVTASVLGTAAGSVRLVLSSDAAGSGGIALIDSTSTGGTLQQIGLIDGTYAGGSNADGSASSGKFTSTEIAIGQLLGLVSPPATTIKVGNRTIAVDLAVDTLSTLAAKIMAAGVGARTTSSVDNNGVTQSRLAVDAALSAAPSAGNPSVPDADSQRVLQMLGVLAAGRSGVTQVLGSTALTDAANATATGATLLVGLKANGGSANIQAGDSVVLSGKRGDGTAVSQTFAVGAGTTMDDLLLQLNGAAGFGSGTRTATASLGTDGRLHLTDGTAGESQLTLALTVNKSVANGGGSTGIGAFALDTAGRVREVTQGSDARVRVDGVLLTRPGNAISDAVSGVTLSLQQAEVGTKITVSVARDTATPLTAVKSFVSAYNALQSFVRKNTASGASLAHSTALTSSARAFTNTLLSDVTGAGFTRSALVGVALDKTGVLTLDETAFQKALTTDTAGVRSLFALAGSATGAGLEYVSANDNTKAGSYAVNISALATRATATGSAATFPYVAGGTQAHLNVTDASTGITDAVVLNGGDDASAVAARLNTLFNSRRMQLSASTSGGQLSISSTQYGATGFTLAYDAGDATSATQLGLAAGARTGVNVAGTINGVAAVGVGQTLTAAAGDAADGLALRYTGSALGAIGSATVLAGVAAQMARAASLITRAGDGTVALNVDALGISITKATAHSDDVSGRLERKKASLLKQFAAMEAALQRISAQGNSLTSSLNALTSLQSGK
jgi:flagellar hook-associated protein 2